MGLSMSERKAVTSATAKRYRVASKKEKGRILNQFVQLTEYTRCYGSYVLRNGHRRAVRKARVRRKRERTYDDEVLSIVKRIWYICDCICGKRLAPYLEEIVSVLERHGELALGRELRGKVTKISAATVDRILAREKAKFRLKSKARTKPGTLLKNQIPIRTFAEWDEKKPGFVEIDLVGHDSGNTRGDYTQTLDVTDVCTAWTETQAVKNKAQIWVFEALKDIRNRLPFRLLGIDSDNGSEFINDQLLRFCKEEGITFTRSRAYRKNDNCYVEQKNYSVVRRAVGYARYDTEAELEVLNTLYYSLRPYTNFFQPVMKLREKTRIGRDTKRIYDRAKTPYQRVIDSPCVSEEAKEALRDVYLQLNPVALKKKITKLQNKLIQKRINGIHPEKELSSGHSVDLVYNLESEALK